MTVNEMASLVIKDKGPIIEKGLLCLVRFESVIVKCEVMDLRERFGRMDVRVRPVEGMEGQVGQWVSKDRIQLLK